MKINLLCYYVYNMWQNFVNSYQIYRHDRREEQA